MPTLNDMIIRVRNLVVSKGFSPTDTEHKLFCAFVELAEAADVWKKTKCRGQYLSKKGVYVDAKEAFMEEIVDVLHYLVDSVGCVDDAYDLDRAFTKKLNFNIGREERYGEAKSTT